MKEDQGGGGSGGLEVALIEQSWYGWWKSASVDAKQDQMLRGADTGSRLTLVISPRGSHHLAGVNRPGHRQNPQRLASDVSCSIRTSVHFFEQYPTRCRSKELLKDMEKGFHSQSATRRTCSPDISSLAVVFSATADLCGKKKKKKIHRSNCFGYSGG